MVCVKMRLLKTRRCSGLVSRKIRRHDSPMRKFSIFIFALILSGNLLARESTLLDSGWRFKSGEITNAGQSGFNDSDWQAVPIPHNWGWEEAQQGKDFYRGPGWYRRDLNMGAPQSGKRYFLRFEAASLVADVYLNGAWLGQHRGAFGAVILLDDPVQMDIDEVLTRRRAQCPTTSGFT